MVRYRAINSFDGYQTSNSLDLVLEGEKWTNY